MLFVWLLKEFEYSDSFYITIETDFQIVPFLAYLIDCLYVCYVYIAFHYQHWIVLSMWKNKVIFTAYP